MSFIKTTAGKTTLGSQKYLFLYNNLLLYNDGP